MTGSARGGAADRPLDGIHVFDVWDSQESFDRFGQTLMPVLQELGIDGAPHVMPVHNIIQG